MMPMEHVSPGGVSHRMLESIGEIQRMARNVSQVDEDLMDAPIFDGGGHLGIGSL